eukprot:11178350-Alexandrium_andersonii.AAC.1
MLLRSCASAGARSAFECNLRGTELRVPSCCFCCCCCNFFVPALLGPGSPVIALDIWLIEHKTWACLCLCLCLGWRVGGGRAGLDVGAGAQACARACLHARVDLSLIHI